LKVKYDKVSSENNNKEIKCVELKSQLEKLKLELEEKKEIKRKINELRNQHKINEKDLIDINRQKNITLISSKGSNTLKFDNSIYDLNQLENNKKISMKRMTMGLPSRNDNNNNRRNSS